jgi:hypothetical protein
MKAKVCLFFVHWAARPVNLLNSNREAVILRPIAWTCHPYSLQAAPILLSVLILIWLVMQSSFFLEWTFYSSLPSSYTGPVILLYWMLVYFVVSGGIIHPCLMGSPAILLFCLKTCHLFSWMTISALFTLLEGNLREPSLSQRMWLKPTLWDDLAVAFPFYPPTQFLIVFCCSCLVGFITVLHPAQCSLPSVKKKTWWTGFHQGTFSVSYSSLFISILVKIYA